MTIEFTADDYELFLIDTLIQERISFLVNKQKKLLDEVFEGRKKIILASFGHKWTTLRSWHKTTPFHNEKDMLALKEKVGENFVEARRIKRDLKSLCDIHNQFAKYDQLISKIQSNNFELLVDERWNEEIKILSNFGIKMTKEESEKYFVELYKKNHH